MIFKGNEYSIKNHLSGFYDALIHEQSVNPEVNIYDVIDRYIKNQVDCENGMEEYFNFLKEVDRRNDRLLRAIKSVKGKSFHKHLKEFIRNSEPAEGHQWTIVSEPDGKEHPENESGRAIRRYWSWQTAQGTEGDSWWGAICVEIKPNKYLRFNFSM